MPNSGIKIRGLYHGKHIEEATPQMLMDPAFYPLPDKKTKTSGIHCDYCKKEFNVGETECSKCGAVKMGHISNSEQYRPYTKSYKPDWKQDEQLTMELSGVSLKESLMLAIGLGIIAFLLSITGIVRWGI
jgi:ribosomal protein L37E